MKILFVRPAPSRETIGLQHVMIVEPLELEILAATLGEADAPVIVDMILERKTVADFICAEKPDVFCVTGYVTNVPAIKEYCATAKRIDPRIVTIAGGVHCEVCPDDIDSPYIDFRVVRNAVSVFPILMDHIRGCADFPQNVLKPGMKICDITLAPFNFAIPPARRDLTSRYRKKYFYIFAGPVALIKTSFGCPYTCTFCFCRQITDSHYHERPLSEVIEELKLIKETDVYIVDDDFLVSRKRIAEFVGLCSANDIRKRYLVYGRADFIASNPDLLAGLASVGLTTVIVGFESFFDAELARYEKNTDSSVNEEAVRVLAENNIDCYATLIIPPEWGREEFRACGEKVGKLGLKYVNLQPLTPLPGTGMKADAGSLLIPYSDYERWDLAHVTIRPSKMSVSDFYGSIIRLYQAILFRPKFLREYLSRYSVRMIYKMIRGTFLVWLQYRKRMKGSVYAENSVHPADTIRS